jgi:hypothetical protein
MNSRAARNILQEYKLFEMLAVVPSDTTQRVQYELAALCLNNETLAKRFLGFNLRLEAMDVASREEPIKDLQGKSSVMADLTAFLCAFSTTFMELVSVTENHVKLQEDGDQLTFKHASEGLSVFEVDEKIISEDDIRRIELALARELRALFKRRTSQ